MDIKEIVKVYIIVQTNKSNDHQVIVDETSSESTAKSIVQLQNTYCCDKDLSYHYELAEKEILW